MRRHKLVGQCFSTADGECFSTADGECISAGILTVAQSGDILRIPVVHPY